VVSSKTGILMEKIEALKKNNEALRVENQKLKATVQELEDSVRYLLNKLKNINWNPNSWQKKKSNNLANEGNNTKVGRRPGFKGTSRKRPMIIHERIELKLECCPSCRGSLNKLNEKRSRCVVGIQVPQQWVREYISDVYYCPRCRKKTYPSARGNTEV
jgi:uncharacterized protein YbaR (Trm112 family)